jgi:hypothetical protein
MHFLTSLASVIDTSGLPHTATDGAVNKIVTITLSITAAVALLMIVIGGFRYILARGDPNGMNQARNTIIYSLVGLAITMAAYSIVTFVVHGVGS